MWVAVTFAAISGTGTIFLVWFLLGLLRERAPSICYWIVPVRKDPGRERHRELMSGIYDDQDCRTPDERSDYYVEVLENTRHAKECASGLIALDIRPVSARLGWSSSGSGREQFFQERRF